VHFAREEVQHESSSLAENNNTSAAAKASWENAIQWKMSFVQSLYVGRGERREGRRRHGEEGEKHEARTIVVIAAVSESGL
tara:strand:+ start:89 stop:331 length:243 start_codon:yes stop_codon:yes gene_type:complete